MFQVESILTSGKLQSHTISKWHRNIQSEDDWVYMIAYYMDRISTKACLMSHWYYSMPTWITGHRHDDFLLIKNIRHFTETASQESLCFLYKFPALHTLIFKVPELSNLVIFQLSNVAMSDLWMTVTSEKVQLKTGTWLDLRQKRVLLRQLWRYLTVPDGI